MFSSEIWIIYRTCLFQCTLDVVYVFQSTVYLTVGNFKEKKKEKTNKPVALHNGINILNIYIFGDFCTMVAVSWPLWIFLLNVNSTALVGEGLGSLHFVTVCSVCTYI